MDPTSNVIVTFDIEFYRNLLNKIKSKIGNLQIRTVEDFDNNLTELLLKYKNVINSQEELLDGLDLEKDVKQNTNETYKSHLHVYPDNNLSKLNQVCHREVRKVVNVLSDLKSERVEEYFQTKQEFINCVNTAKQSLSLV